MQGKGMEGRTLILNRVAMKSFFEKVAFEQRLEWSKKVNHVRIWEDRIALQRSLSRNELGSSRKSKEASVKWAKETMVADEAKKR